MVLRIHLFLLLLLLAIPCTAQTIIYVDSNAGGNQDGTSWEHAFSSLQDALEAAQTEDEVWVAAGRYYPDLGQSVTPGDRSASFVLKNGVSIFGGFIGTESALSDRDWKLNETILSGDLNEDDTETITLEEPTRSDNSFHVLTAKAGTDSTAILDGFTVRSGHAALPNNIPFGGGLIIEVNQTSSLKLSQLKFEHNYSEECGGAITNFAGPITISHSSFRGNVAEATSHCGGGALFHSPYHDDALVAIDEVFFESNQANQGGALSVFTGNVQVIRSTFLHNTASLEGGAVHHNQVKQSNNAEALYGNVLFLGNQALALGGGAMSNERSIVTVYNTLFSGNRAISDSSGSVAEGGLGGAISGIEESDIAIIQSTIVNNGARIGGGIVSTGNSRISISNSIIWDNESKEIGTESLYISELNQDTLRISYSLISGSLPSNAIDEGGMLFTDPLFANSLGDDSLPGTLDDDLRLSKNSPAIDAGINSALPSDFLDLDNDGDQAEQLPVDLDNNSRLFDGSGSGAIVDLGSYEYHNGTVGTKIDPSDEPSQPCTKEILSPAYPNPFSSSTHISLCSKRSVDITLALYDVLGRRRATLFKGTLRGGISIPVSINAQDLPNGVYIVALLANGIQASKTITVVK